MLNCRHPLLSLWSVPLRELCNASVSVLGEIASAWQLFSNCPRKTLKKMDEQCEEETARGYRDRIQGIQ